MIARLARPLTTCILRSSGICPSLARISVLRPSFEKRPLIKISSLVAEMPDPAKNHRHPSAVGSLYYFRVSH